MSATEEPQARRPVTTELGRLSTKIVYIVPCNGEYAVLKEFAELEKTPNVPALTLPFLDIVSLAKGYGCAAEAPSTKEEIQTAFQRALELDGPTLLAIPTAHEDKSLVPD